MPSRYSSRNHRVVGRLNAKKCPNFARKILGVARGGGHVGCLRRIVVSMKSGGESSIRQSELAPDAVPAQERQDEKSSMPDHDGERTGLSARFSCPLGSRPFRFGRAAWKEV
jgi:hypothetical protein